MQNKRPYLLLIVLLAVGLTSAAANPIAAQNPDRLDRLVLAGPPGPLSIPLVYLVANDKLAGVADEVEFVVWQDQNQLRALIAGEQADFVTMPSNNAAIFYNSGFDLQLLDISVWNSSYAVSADESIASLVDAAGLRVVIPFEGSVPDLLFQVLAQANGLDPLADFDLLYSSNPSQAAQMLLAGQADLAILPEPLVTAVLLQTRDAEAPLQRVFSIGAEWDAVTEDEVQTAIAGTVALAAVAAQPEVVEAFTREYALAVEWVIENPEAAGEMAEELLPELGFVARPVALSLQHVVWEVVPAAEGREAIDAFFGVLLALSPDVVGGELPDEDFYYGVPVAE